MRKKGRGGPSPRVILGVAIALIVVATALVATRLSGSGELESTVNEYYKVVRDGDVQAQVAAWLPDQAEEAQRQARMWEQADRSNLKVVDTHTVEMDDPGQMIVHVVLQTENSARELVVQQETWTLLLEKSGNRWLIQSALLGWK